MNERIEPTRRRPLLLRAVAALAFFGFVLLLFWGEPLDVLLPGLAVGALVAAGLIIDVAWDGKRRSRAEAGIVASVIALAVYVQWFEMPFSWSTLVITIALGAIAARSLTKGLQVHRL